MRRFSKRRSFLCNHEVALVVLVLAVTLFFAYADDIDMTGNAISGSLPSWARSWAAVPWDVTEPLVTRLGADFQNGRAVITANAHYIWRTGYVWNAAERKWKQFTFPQSSQYDGWASGSARAEIPLTSDDVLSGENYVVAYTCQWKNERWYCGCLNEQSGADGALLSCGRWQLQTFTAQRFDQTILEDMTRYITNPSAVPGFEERVRDVALPDSGIAEEPRADFNGDGYVNFGDFFQFAGAFGTSEAKFDMSGNGMVDYDDFFAFADNFGKRVVHKEHTIKFYLDPKLAQDIGFAKQALSVYVEDMNYVLSKNTNRRLVFDPDKNIILTSTRPQTNSHPINLITDDYEIWAHVTKNTRQDYTSSYGGYAGGDISGAGVLAGLYWSKIYDPKNLADIDELDDYWGQITAMMHELAHVFGAGSLEYYDLAEVDDTTNIEPIINIRLSEPDDSYWKNKHDYFSDPLLGDIMHLTVPYPKLYETRGEVLNSLQYSQLTAKIISGFYRLQWDKRLPNMDEITIRVVDSSGNPIPSSTVKVFSIIVSRPYGSSLSEDKMTDMNGKIVFDWEPAPYLPYFTGANLKLIKVYKDGYQSTAKYVSLVDAEEVKILQNESKWTIVIQMTRV